MIPDEKMFYFSGGRRAASLEELKDILHEIGDEEFVFHVNTGKNDLANWAEGVFNEGELARELRKVFERKDTIAILTRFLRARKHPYSKKNHPVWTEPEQKALPAFDMEKQESFPVVQPGAVSNPEEMPENPREGGDSFLNDFFKTDARDELPGQETGRDNTSADVLLDDANLHADLQEGSAHALTEDELHKIAIDAREEIIGVKDQPQAPDDLVIKEPPEAARKESPKFIVKEFIYGFVLGLIFGLIMLGILFNLRAC